jgi:hypothetical protein
LSRAVCGKLNCGSGAEKEKASSLNTTKDAGGSRQPAPDLTPECSQFQESTSLAAAQIKPRLKETRARNSRRGGTLVNKTLKGKVGKALTKGTGISGKEPTDKLPSHAFSTTTENVNEESIVQGGGLQLEQATKRRTEWTPAKNSTTTVIDLVGDGAESPSEEPHVSGRDFGDHLSSYGFNGEIRPAGKIQPQKVDENFTKRRRVEVWQQQMASFYGRMY